MSFFSQIMGKSSDSLVEVKENTTLCISGPLNLTSLWNIEFYKRFASKIVVQYWGGPISQKDIDEWKKDPDNDQDPVKYLYRYYSDDERVKILPIKDPLQDKEYVTLYDHRIITDYGTWYFQVKSIFEALKVVDTKYVIRTRADEFVEDLAPLLKSFAGNTKKLVCTNIFFKSPICGDGAAGFHVGDHMFMAETETLYKTYDIICGSYDRVIEAKTRDDIEIPPWIDCSADIYNSVRNVENILGLSWLHASTEHDALDIPGMDIFKRYELLINHFGLVSVFDLGMYNLKWNGASSSYEPYNNPFWHGNCLCSLPLEADHLKTEEKDAEGNWLVRSENDWHKYHLKWCRRDPQQPPNTPQRPDDDEYTVKKKEYIEELRGKLEKRKKKS